MAAEDAVAIIGPSINYGKPRSDYLGPCKCGSGVRATVQYLEKKSILVAIRPSTLVASDFRFLLVLTILKAGNPGLADHF